MRETEPTGLSPAKATKIIGMASRFAQPTIRAVHDSRDPVGSSAPHSSQCQRATVATNSGRSTSATIRITASSFSTARIRTSGEAVAGRG
jgi:hypothetical protein